MNFNKKIVIFSLLLGLAALIFHELGHYLVANYFGLNPRFGVTLIAVHVAFKHGTPIQNILVRAGGFLMLVSLPLFRAVIKKEKFALVVFASIMVGYCTGEVLLAFNFWVGVLAQVAPLGMAGIYIVHRVLPDIKEYLTCRMWKRNL